MHIHDREKGSGELRKDEERGSLATGKLHHAIRALVACPSASRWLIFSQREADGQVLPFLARVESQIDPQLSPASEQFFPYVSTTTPSFHPVSSKALVANAHRSFISPFPFRSLHEKGHGGMFHADPWAG